MSGASGKRSTTDASWAAKDLHSRRAFISTGQDLVRGAHRGTRGFSGSSGKGCGRDRARARCASSVRPAAGAGRRPNVGRKGTNDEGHPKEGEKSDDEAHDRDTERMACSTARAARGGEGAHAS